MLEHYLPRVAAWCEEMGARMLDEVEEEAAVGVEGEAHCVDCVGITGSAVRVVLAACSERVARLAVELQRASCCDSARPGPACAANLPQKTEAAGTGRLPPSAP